MDTFPVQTGISPIKIQVTAPRVQAVHQIHESNLGVGSSIIGINERSAPNTVRTYRVYTPYTVRYPRYEKYLTFVTTCSWRPLTSTDSNIISSASPLSVTSLLKTGGMSSYHALSILSILSDPLSNFGCPLGPNIYDAEGLDIQCNRGGLAPSQGLETAIALAGDGLGPNARTLHSGPSTACLSKTEDLDIYEGDRRWFGIGEYVAKNNLAG
ncbi:uncharacterized protein BDR25DRAFT_351350 [Lindgomyces ingoldianus]|uniref:Uncharacterized protein n=1 Tax=Lindgomyces ingoldianus TaxID=673940 RepID=A0ACB6R6H5_9PLEO|nr:uncharacterized protein BDR25DRAFT_351350 [Lindgomyces ingoldianus]KAF2474849.1 hypothetical protein BDR25DRAFT_351350 [Lindgomyces ingoldianus]